MSPAASLAWRCVLRPQAHHHSASHGLLLLQVLGGGHSGPAAVKWPLQQPTDHRQLGTLRQHQAGSKTPVDTPPPRQLASRLAASLVVEQQRACWRALLHTSTAASQQQQQQQQQARPRDASAVEHAEGAPPAGAAAPPAGRQRVLGSSFTSIPNLLSLSRVALGPWLAHSIVTQQWPLAVGITAYAGASDWLDGFLARRLGHTSKLGSYLDPLADKLFVGAAVGTMGWLGMLPGWLAVLVVGRDGAQVAGMFVYRLRMFGGCWPGASAFFDVDADAPPPSQQPQQGTDKDSPAQQAAAAGQPAGGGLPVIRPLLVSKANTALVMLLVAGSMGQQWQGLPSQQVLDALELLAGATTACSAAAYAWLHWTGQLLVTSASASAVAHGLERQRRQPPDGRV